MRIHVGCLVILVSTLCMPLLVFAGCDVPAPADHLFIASNSLLREYDFAGHGLTRIHDYGHGSLVQITGADGLPPEALAQLQEVEDPASVAYRSFSTRFDPATLPTPDGFPPGVYLLAMVGPLDSGVRAAVERTGLKVLDTANPFGLLVQGDARSMTEALALCTTEGYRMVRAVFTLTPEARLGGTLRRWAAGELPDLARTNLVRTDDGAAVVRVQFYEGADATESAVLLGNYWQAAPAAYPGAWAAHRDRLLPALQNIPSIAYIEPLAVDGPSANIAVREGVMNIAPAWDLGYEGSGVTLWLNDYDIDWKTSEMEDPHV